MRLQIWASITYAEPAVFVSTRPIEETLRSLAAIVERSAFANWGVDCLVGHVTTARVRIARHRAGQRRPTRPVFLGKFCQENDRAVLRGRSTYPWSTRLLAIAFLAVLLIFALVLAIFGGALLITNERRDATLWGAVMALILSVALVAAVFKVTQPFEREDIAWISERVEAAIGSASQETAHGAE